MYKDMLKIEIGWMSSSDYHGTVIICNTDWTLWEEGTYRFGDQESEGRGYDSTKNFSLKKIFLKE